MPINIKTNAINIRDSDGYDNVDALFAGDISEVVVPWLNSHSPYGYVTPEMFGAVGDGATDDTTALQNCLSASAVVILTGTYKIKSTLTLHSNLYINGCGVGKVVKDTSVATYYSAFSYYDNTTIEDVTIEGLSIIGVKHWTGLTTSGLANDYGIRIINGNNIKVIKCNVTDCGACAVAVSGKSVLIGNNTITYTGTFSGETPNYNFGISYSGEDFKITGNIISGVIHGVASGLKSKNVIISENDISTNGQHGLYIAHADNVQVVNNIIHDCSLCGVKFQIGDDSLSEFQGIIIADNVIKNCADHGVLVVDLENLYILSDIAITGNYVDGTLSGIHVDSSDSVIISSNILKNTTSYGIRIVATNNILVDANKIITENGYAIHFADGTKARNKNISVKNNTVKYSGASSGYGITLYKGENVFVSENELTCEVNGNTKIGIRINNTSDSTEYVYITNNFARGFSTNYSATSPNGITTADNHFI